ncbi:carotenoid biosynthesis protein [Mangrovibacterium lignilyticum]|uniref:carotenoid biosynthesis protein n=1 Tax=Mangrovibacterium lignilyticum TaxID=2668052 RepID=UPI0013D175AD|nr:carotenoid biosynthesis protein [Mangrovibacterium lignilyticum]
MPERSKLVVAARAVIAILYLVGIVGFSMPASRELFAELSPLNLCLSVVLLLWFQEHWSVKTLLSIVIVVLIGFGAELLGTRTGLLFGNYKYGPVLGIKVWETPLLIGANWLVLCYGIYVLLSRFRLQWRLPVVGAALMVAFDFVMEPVATQLNIWSWQDGHIPFKNYLDWFLVSFFLFAGMNFLKLNLRNQLAVWIIMCQFIFFLVLNFSLNLL